MALLSTPSHPPHERGGGALALHVERDRLKRIVDAVSDAAALIAVNSPTLDALLASTMDTVHCTGAAVQLLDDDALVTAAARGWLKHEAGQSVAAGDGLVGRCLSERRPQSGLAVGRCGTSAEGARDCTLLAMPLIDQDAPIGVLKVVSDGMFDALDRFALCIHGRLLVAGIARQRMSAQNRELLAQRSAALDYVTAVLGTSPTGMVVQAHDGIVQMLNPAAETLLGISAAQALGRPFTLGDDIVEIASVSEPVIEGVMPHRMLVRALPSGQTLEILLSEAVLRGRNGAPVGLVCTLQDLSAERTRSAVASEGEQRIRRIIEHSQEAFISMDESGTIVEWNGTAQRLFGWSHDEAVGSSLEHLLVPQPLRKAFERTVTEYLSTGRSNVIGGRIEAELMRRDGSALTVDVSINATHQDGHVLFDAFAQDITERRAELDSLRREAMQDTLTGLANRAQFMRRLKSAYQRQSPEGLAVMFVDLDGFKGVNDNFGHNAGDELLREVAQRMRRCVRQRDTVARLAGDEFVVLLEAPGGAAHEAATAAERILDAFRAPVVLDEGHEQAIHASLGIAALEPRDESPQDLMHRADSAMYEAKRAGGSRVFFLSGSRAPARVQRVH